jgi:hypothetical protein
LKIDVPAQCRSNIALRTLNDDKNPVRSSLQHANQLGREPIDGINRQHLEKGHRRAEYTQSSPRRGTRFIGSHAVTSRFMSSLAQQGCGVGSDIKKIRESRTSAFRIKIQSDLQTRLEGSRRAAIACQSESNPLCNQVCLSGNSALYGSCMASDFNRFLVLNLPNASNPGFAGMPVSFTAVKKDAYNQTITSDSSSVVQVQPASHQHGDNSFFLVGESVFNMKTGEVQASITVKPYFSNISFVKQIAVLKEQPLFVLTSADSQSSINAERQSDVFSVPLHDGSAVCPPGYVLMLDDRTHVQGPAVCDLCKAGTYSLNPLAPSPTSISPLPSCLNCPAGGNCIQGGSTVSFVIGAWESTGSLYMLRSCPVGYRLVKSTAGKSSGMFAHDSQQCVACLPGQYSVPRGDLCQKCPAGKLWQSTLLFQVWQNMPS